MGISLLLKFNVVIHMLAYGSPTDIIDEYAQIDEITTVGCLERFGRGVDEVFMG